ncbi:MAG: ABC-2 transporter permease [Clostridia bacterium]|nr:ABC-2 transporter permease [Clostridia bacterium]
MFAIYKKEMRSYFTNPIGYIFTGIFLVFSALLCCITTILSGSYETNTYFTVLVYSLVVLIPLLTMRLFSEERKIRTEQLLLTAPVTLTGMVLGKFFAALTLFMGCVGVSLVNLIPLYAIAAAERGSIDNDTINIGPVTSEIVGCVIGVILIGAVFIAIGTFVSSLCENQLAAAVMSVAVIVGFVGVGLFASFIDVYAIRLVLSWISITARFENFANGIFDFGALVYLLSLAFVFVFLTVRVYEKRRWS